MTVSTFGARSLIPDEHLEGYAPHASLTDGWLWKPGAPLQGRITRIVGYPSPSIISIAIGLSEFPQNGTRVVVWQAAYDAVIGGIRRNWDAGIGPAHPNPDFVFRWRAGGSSSAWNEVPGQYLGVNLSSNPSKYTEGARTIGVVGIDDIRLNPLSVEYDATVADLPATDDVIEFYLVGPIPPDELHPVIIENLTAGEFLINMYSGAYSLRDPITNAVVPTGISYEATAFTAMSDLVRIRHFEPVEDARDFAEKYIYAPTGFAPALDYLGRVAPVSQIPPADLDSLTTITDAMAEPTHEWDAGQRIINLVRFTYPRDYSMGDPDPPGDGAGEISHRQDLLGEREIVQEYRNDLSIERFGEQVLELDGSAFRAIGREPTTPEEADLDPGNIPPKRPRSVERRNRQLGIPPVTQTPIVRTGQHVIPASGDIQDETGWQLAELRGTHLLNRYAFGAPTLRLHVMRSAIPDVWCGSWVWLNLKQFPDYVTQRRGLFALAQVVAVGELDCAWRRLRCEVVAPIAEES